MRLRILKQLYLLTLGLFLLSGSAQSQPSPRQAEGAQGSTPPQVSCGCGDVDLTACCPAPTCNDVDLTACCNCPAPTCNDVDLTACCKVTPPEPPPCTYYRGDIIDLGFSETKLESYDRIFERTGSAGGLKCLDDMINRAITACNSHFATQTTNGIKHHDDCLAWEFASYTMPNWEPGSWPKWTQRLGQHDNGAVCTALHMADMATCPSDSPLGFKFAGGCKPCGAGYFFFKQDPQNPNKCVVVQKPSDSEQQCGAFKLNYFNSTPVSLVWSHADVSARFVRFPLDPRRPGLWQLWKGSAALPLLVFDPNREGRVTSAAQLFGNWTFGGKRHASLTQASAAPWENGYEALAVLDDNGDQKLTGEELKNLALWFDGNQNAVSEPGEVKSLADAGVTELRTGPYATDAEGNLFIDAGYTRTVGGRSVAEKSIDWITTGAASQLDLLAQFNGPAAAVPAANKAATARDLPAKPAKDSAPSPAPAAADYIGGAWDWEIAGDGDVAPHGHFILVDKGVGVAGYSLTETTFKRGDGPAKNSYVTLVGLTGEKLVKHDGALVFKFKAIGSEAELLSEATVSKDRKSMQGMTTLTSGNRHGGRKTVTYSWQAKHR